MRYLRFQEFAPPSPGKLYYESYWNRLRLCIKHIAQAQVCGRPPFWFLHSGFGTGESALRAPERSRSVLRVRSVLTLRFWLSGVGVCKNWEILDFFSLSFFSKFRKLNNYGMILFNVHKIERCRKIWHKNFACLEIKKRKS